jgi:dihydromethanopterin reductase
VLLKLIAAVGKRGQIGLNGELPWHLPEDLVNFRRLTTNGLLIMGHRTLQSCKHLDGTFGRQLLLDRADLLPEDVDSLRVLGGFADVWVCGGAKTYQRWMPHVHTTVITLVDYDGPADVYMPPLWG